MTLVIEINPNGTIHSTMVGLVPRYWPAVIARVHYNIGPATNKQMFAPLLPILFAIVTAIEPADVDAAKDAKGQALCEATSGGYHYVNTGTTFGSASQVCAAYGWRLADVTDESAYHVLYVLQKCMCGGAKKLGQSLKWIQSFNGYAGDPCMMLDKDGFISVGLGSACIQSINGDVTIAVICQEIPLITTTVSSLSTWTVTQGIATATATVTAPRPINPLSRINGDDPRFFKKSHDPRRPGPCIDCHEVCPFQSAAYRIIHRNITNYAQASVACRQHGWVLADVTSGSLRDVQDLGSLCSSATLLAKSYNGIEAAACNYIEQGVFKWGLTPEMCNQVIASNPDILCQVNGNIAIDGHGGWQGATATTTTTYQSTVMLVIPSSTTTVTVTKSCQQY